MADKAKKKPPAPGPDGKPCPSDPTMEKILSIIEPKLQHFFNRPIYLRTALQTTGSPVQDLDPPQGFYRFSIAEGNARLAVVGDLAIRLTVADYYYSRGADGSQIALEAEAVATNDSVRRLGEHLGLDDLFRMGSGSAATAAGYDLLTTVRAIVGAVFCDGGVVGVRMVLVAFGVLDAKRIDMPYFPLGS